MNGGITLLGVAMVAVRIGDVAAENHDALPLLFHCKYQSVFHSLR